jgi:sec-independent protein translocase protein TatA
MGGTFSIWHWLIIGGLVLILFGGKGKISEIMGDVAKGIKSFKKGLAEEEKPAVPGETPQAIDHRPSVEASKISDTQKTG